MNPIIAAVISLCVAANAIAFWLILISHKEGKKKDTKAYRVIEFKKSQGGLGPPVNDEITKAMKDQKKVIDEWRESVRKAHENFDIRN